MRGIKFHQKNPKQTVLTTVPKEISALRDDIKNLLTSIIDRLKNKISILQDIYNSETNKRYLLKSGSISNLLHSIENDNFQFEKIDVFDYEIAGLKERICEIAGIDIDSFDLHLSKLNSKLYGEYSELVMEMNNVIGILSREREELIKDMEEQLDNINFDIESLKNIMRLKGL